MPTELDALISPRRVALIGASDTATRLSARPQLFLKAQGFEGEVIPVNPRRDTVLGTPAVASVAEAGAIEHAYILLDAEPAIVALEDCATAGVRVVSMLADGFAETGPEGQARQDRVAAIAREAGVRLIGPNSTGVIHVPNGFFCTANAAFAADDIPIGGLTVLSQSGSMIGMLASRGAARGTGFASFVSLGNEAVTDVGTLGSLMLDDPATDSFALFLETVRNAEALAGFARAAHAVGKPVLAYVVGQSDEGQHLAVSHTGAMAGQRGAISCFLRDIGIAEVSVLDALLDAPRTMVRARPDPFRPRSVTVITTTGGGGGMVLDQINARGVTIAGCGSQTRAKLGPKGIALGSGKLVDVTMAGAQPGVMKAVVSSLLSDPETGILIAALGSSAQFNPELTVDPLLEALKDRTDGDAPLVVMPLPQATEALKILAKNEIPTFITPESCAESIAVLFDAPTPTPRGSFDLPSEVCALLDAAPEGVMDEVAAGVIFAALGVPQPRQVVLAPDEADAPVDLTYPVVAKLVSSALPHKTEAGAITLNIPDRAALSEAIATMRARVREPITAILVQEMAQGQGEALVGLTRDARVGPLVTLAAGGVLAEVLNDATMRPAPVTHGTAVKMVQEIKCFAPLRGYRGHVAGDLDGLARTIEAVSRLAAHPRVSEAEINPLLIGADGVSRLDALIRIENPQDQ
jgi:acyl-CoA synthetase (NDP forming)